MGGGTTSTTTVSTTTSTTLASGSGNLSLVAGWNLVGNGYEVGFDVSALFADSSSITSVWKWVASKTAWAFYAPSLSAQGLSDYAASKGYEVLSRVEAGEGFWVNAKQAKGVSLPAGTAVASGSFSATGARPVGAGWSLIATGDRPTPASFDKALSISPPSPGQLPMNLTSLWAWDTATPGWYFWAPSLVNAGTLSNYLSSKSYLDFTNMTNSPAGTISPSTGIWVNRP